MRQNDATIFSESVGISTFFHSSFIYSLGKGSTAHISQFFEISCSFIKFQKFFILDNMSYSTVKIQKRRKGVMWWRTRDSLSHVSQQSDSQQNQGVSQTSLFLDLNGISDEPYIRSCIPNDNLNNGAKNINLFLQIFMKSSCKIKC